MTRARSLLSRAGTRYRKPVNRLKLSMHRFMSLIDMREQPVKQRVSPPNRLNAMFVRNGIGINWNKPTYHRGFERAVASIEWHDGKKPAIDVISRQVYGILETGKRLKR